MTLKIRGESEIAVSTTREPSEFLAAARTALGEFEQQEQAVISTEVAFDGTDHDLQIKIVLRVSSYAQAEEVMTRLQSYLATALTDAASVTAPGATELVPA